MRSLLAVLVVMMMGCAREESAFVGAQDPLVYDAAAVARAETVAILIPGALAPIGIFAPARAWERRGYALVYYRFPGLDGLPLDHRLGIDQAADRIAAFAAQHPDKKFRLLGYSTGGPVALVASQRMSGDVRVAAMSPAVEHGGGLPTALRGAIDITAAAARARSLQRPDIWLEYYRTLLYGRAGLRDAEKRALSRQIAQDEKAEIVVPDAELTRAHSEDLRHWDLDGVRVTDPARVRFFIGLEDPVFSTRQTTRFAARLGGPDITGYAGDGHLLFLTRPQVFEDIFAFFEAPG